MIGAPKSTTLWPRWRPSVASMEMQRHIPPPRCCETSRIILVSVPTISKAFKIGGSLSSGKRTSTTAPIIWATVPEPAAAASSFFACGAAGAAFSATFSAAFSFCSVANLLTPGEEKKIGGYEMFFSLWNRKKGGPKTNLLRRKYRR